MKRRHGFIYILTILVGLPLGQFNAQAGDGLRSAPPIRGLITPLAQATLSSTMDGLIQAIFVKDGDSFKKGVRLVQFDCSVEQAQLQKAQAAMNGNRKRLTVHEELIKLRSASHLDGVLIESSLDQAKAEVAVRQAEVDRCNIYAPFAGQVAQRFVHPYESVSKGEPLVEIVKVDGFEVLVIVPSNRYIQMVPGSRFSIRIEETGNSYPVRVVRRSARIDPVSQTIRVTGRVAGNFPELIPGMSGPITVPR